MSARPREHGTVHPSHSTSLDSAHRIARNSIYQIPNSLQDVVKQSAKALHSRNPSLNSSRVGHSNSQSRSSLGYKRSTLFIQTEPIKTPRLPSQCNEYSEIPFNFQTKKDEKRDPVPCRTSIMGPANQIQPSQTKMVNEFSLSYKPTKASPPCPELDERQGFNLNKEFQSKDAKIERLKGENAKLTNELHKLKKAEAGMMLGGNNKIATENIQLRNLVDSMKNEIQHLQKIVRDREATQESSREMAQELGRLKKLIAQYENDNQKLVVDLGQAKKTEEEKDLKIASAFKEIAFLKNRLTDEQGKCEKITAQNTDIRLKYNALHTQVSVVKTNEVKASSDEKSFARLHTIITSLEKENKRLIGQVKDLRSQIDKESNLKDDIHESKNALFKMTEERDSLKSRLKSEIERVQLLSREKDGLNSKVVELEARLALSLRKQNQTMESESAWRADVENKIGTYKQKLEEKTRELSKALSQSENLKSENQSLAEENSSMQIQLDLIKMGLQKKEAELNSNSRAEFDSLREEINHLNQENIKLREKIRELQKSETSFKLNRLKLSEFDHLNDSFIPQHHLEHLIVKVVLSEAEIQRLQNKLANAKATNESMQTEPDSVLKHQSVRCQKVSGTARQRSYSTFLSQRVALPANRYLSDTDSVDLRTNFDQYHMEN